MKKIISIISLIIFLLTFVGCNKKDINPSINKQPSSVQQTEVVSSNETVINEQPTTNSVAKPAVKLLVKTTTYNVVPTASKNKKSSKKKTKKTSKSKSKKTKSSKKSSKTTVSKVQKKLYPGYKYNTKLSTNNNVFLDALEYTGYNLKKHRKDGLMWKYILSNDKKHRNWLSKITYGGGSTGLETKKGLPNIKKFQKGGLVCASFATYVYFNYLPNVAKIDTSKLAKPKKTYSAESFQAACKKWLKKGYTYKIGFTAKNTATKISFNPKKKIPLGSIIVFRDIDKPSKKKADHITIYVGKKNGYHWVIQTGNKNGPEFCAVERFKFGPDPQWPLEIYATPSCIYDAISKSAKK